MAAAVFMALTSGAYAAERPPVEAFGRLPAISEVTVSPSGHEVAYLQRKQGATKLLVVDDLGKQLLTVDVESSKVRSVEWAGDDKVIVKVSSTVSITRNSFDLSEVLSIAVFSISAHKGMIVFAGRSNIIPAVFGDYGTANIDGRWYGFYAGYTLDASGRLSSGLRQLFRVDLETGRFGVASAGMPFKFESWLTARDGRLIAHEETDSRSGEWRVALGGYPGGETLASGVDPIGAPAILGRGRSEDSVLVAMRGTEAGEIKELVRGQAAPQDLGDGRPILGGVFDPKTGLLIGERQDGDYPTTHFFSPALDAKIASGLALLSAAHPRLVSASDDFSRLIAFTDQDGDSGSYWLVDTDAKTTTLLGRAYPEITPEAVGRTSVATWKASDGTSLQGVLTLPPGERGVNLPLVVLPHGGPEARDRPRFDWWAQAFAARGYAVFQPNFRGSSGYGASFRNAGFGEWGRKMQTDISDGVAALAAEHVIDPSRVCIVGGSYGGYAALAGVTVQHGLYRCAAAYGGVSDPTGMLLYVNGVVHHPSPALRYWRTFMGATGDHDPKLNEISPLVQASHADAPVLLIHGRNDTVVLPRQSEDMASALRAAGKPAELLLLPSEDHWLSTEATRVAMLKAMVDFVEAHNPVQAVASK